MTQSRHLSLPPDYRYCPLENSRSSRACLTGTVLKNGMHPDQLTLVQPMETTVTKPSIVFAHGLWADGSCFGKLIPTLLAEGYEVMASQHGLDSLATDVAAVKACLARVHSPAILVGHSYGGTLITHAGTDARVAGLVYIAALAPDADETSQSLLGKFPTTPGFGHIEVGDGRVWLKQSGVTHFAG